LSYNNKSVAVPDEACVTNILPQLFPCVHGHRTLQKTIEKHFHQSGQLQQQNPLFVTQWTTENTTSIESLWFLDCETPTASLLSAFCASIPFNSFSGNTNIPSGCSLLTTL
jgi:hypothetical protein